MSVASCRLGPSRWLAALALTVGLGASSRAQAQVGDVLGTMPQRSSRTPTTSMSVTLPGDTEVISGERSVITPQTPAPIPLESPLDPDAYICGRGDSFELNFWGRQNFRLRFTVDLEGKAFISRVGYVHIAGKTLTEARAIVSKAVLRYYPGLSFEISLVSPRTFLVHLVENVPKPGIYPANPTERLSTVIQRAGGATGSQRRIEIQRRDGSVLHADLVLYSFTGKVEYNPFVMDGDVIRVPFEGTVATVYGPVRRPGRYELIATKDLKELLDLAGGFKSSLTKQLPIRVVRRNGKEHDEQLAVPFGAQGELPSFALRDDDQVFFPSAQELQRSIFVIGAIAGAQATDEATSVKRVEFQEGDSVRVLLERTGGVNSSADLQRSYIKRDDGKSSTLIPVDLEALLIRRDFSADRSLKIGDTLVVPYKRHAVAVEGAVMRAGLYPYNPRFGLAEYLAAAGGVTKTAQSLNAAKIITPDGKTERYSRRLLILPGDTVSMPERSFTRSEIVQLVMGSASLAISTLAVVLLVVR